LPDVLKAKDILRRGKEAMEQINILGDDGVPMAFHDRYWKSELIDFVILQQDAFDAIDASTPLKRQQYMLMKVLDVTDTSFNYSNFEDVSVFFKEVINLFKQMNYSEFESDTFKQHEASLNQLLDQRKN
jgi:V/A-type H+-transporting ATPase subunit A